MKNKKEKQRKFGPSFDSKKAIFGPSFDSTAYMLIYIYIYIYIDIPFFLPKKMVKMRWDCRNKHFGPSKKDRILSFFGWWYIDLTLIINKTRVLGTFWPKKLLKTQVF